MENYTQVKVLGKGSFGSAWLIQRNSDKMQFVAKEIRLAGLKPAERDSAMNEIIMLRSLDHPNITKYVDHFEYRGSLFIVMEYANGGDLYMKIKGRHGRLFLEKDILHYFSQICLALSYLHDKRILHRDLKSQNVFLTKDGVVKLGDFGISTVLRNTYELKRTVCGTPYYFSPELCENKPYNNKSDVWALGCILYEMSTLNHAFDGNNMKALVHKILRGTYPPINACYSANLSELIASMLQIDPVQRPNVTAIIKAPFIRDSLASLQRQLQEAKEIGASVVPQEEKDRMQRDALKRQEALRQKEIENAAKVAELRERQKMNLENKQKENDERRRQLLDQQRDMQHQQESALEARKKELEARMREQRKQQEKKAKELAEQAKAREAQWDRNMREQAAENKGKQQEEEARQRRVPDPPQRSEQSAQEAAEAYKEMKRQAALNRQRVYEDLGHRAPGSAKEEAPPAAEGAQPPPPAREPRPNQYSTRKMSAEELEEARRQAFWQMHQEADKNKRKVMGEPVVPTTRAPPQRPPSQTQQGTAVSASSAASSPQGSPLLGDLDTDGDDGLHAFLNGEAVLEPEASGIDDKRRNDDYGALNTVIGQALQTDRATNTRKQDFNDEAFNASDIDSMKFMLDGKTLQLSNVSASDPLMHRIESLRMFLEQEMGEDCLIRCYKAMNTLSVDDDEAIQKVTESIPQEKQRFIPLVAQLIVCEDSFNRQGAR